jgi:hypothetical protein
MDLIEEKYRYNLRSLHVLLVISFIITGSQLIWEILGVAGMFPLINEVYANTPSEYSSVFTIKMEQEMAIPQWYNILRALLDLTSIVGLVLMWKLRKNGFHAYTLSKLLLMLLPLMFLDRSYVGFGDIMIAVLFIAYYFFLLKNLGAFSGENSSSNTPPSENQPAEEATESD